MGAAVIHHPATCPVPGRSSGCTSVARRAGMIYHRQLVAFPNTFTCLLGASPPADLHMLRLLKTYAWFPPTPQTGLSCHDFTRHLWAESAHTQVSRPKHTTAFLTSPQTQNVHGRPKHVCLCLLPPSWLPPRLMHLSKWHPHLPQPCNHPHSSLQHHTPI